MHCSRAHSLGRKKFMNMVNTQLQLAINNGSLNMRYEAGELMSPGFSVPAQGATLAGEAGACSQVGGDACLCSIGSMQRVPATTFQPPALQYTYVEIARCPLMVAAASCELAWLSPPPPGQLPLSCWCMMHSHITDICANCVDVQCRQSQGSSMRPKSGCFLCSCPGQRWMMPSSM